MWGGVEGMGRVVERGEGVFKEEEGRRDSDVNGGKKCERKILKKINY